MSQTLQDVDGSSRSLSRQGHHPLRGMLEKLLDAE
jgi:hypothetical protein